MKKITIIITRYNESNELIIPCITSISNQKNVEAVTYFLDQKKDEYMERLCNNLSNKKIKIIYKNIPAISLSNARNTGIRLAKTDYVLFTDCDAIPDTNWAYELALPFTISKKIAIIGGKSSPKWLSKQKWYHHSNILMDIYSLLDLGENIKEIDRIVGVNFVLNKKLLGKDSFFNENLGRRPGSLLGGEESELCKRAIKKGFKIFYNGKARVQHQIQKDRMNLKWIIRRFYYGGYGKALIGGAPKTYSQKRNIYDKLVLGIVTIPYLIGFIKGKIK